MFRFEAEHGGWGSGMFLVGCSILVKARMGKSSTAEMKGRHNTNKEQPEWRFGKAKWRV